MPIEATSVIPNEIARSSRYGLYTHSRYYALILIENLAIEPYSQRRIEGSELYNAKHRQGVMHRYDYV